MSYLILGNRLIFCTGSPRSEQLDVNNLEVPNYELRMAGSFVLRPQDGGKDIAIPCGKTTIGRGPFLGVRNMLCIGVDFSFLPTKCL